MSEKPRKSPKPKHNKKKKKKGSIGKKIALIVVLIFLFLILAGGAVTAFLVVSNYNNLPEWTEIEQAGKSQLYDRDSEFIVEIRGEENRDVVEYSQFPEYLIDAVISTEDTRFYKHNGVDFIRVMGALVADLKSGDASQGGSTLTMQLARNAILNTQEKKIDRKIKEALLAMQIERTYTKEEIMTFYLNEVFFGQSVYGVEAAAQHYFSKSITDCSLSECAMLVGILPSPNSYAPDQNMEKATSVRNQVLKNMVEGKFITQEEADAAAAEEITLSIKEIQGSTEGFDWFTDYSIKEASDILGELGYAKGKVYTGGFKIYTSRDTKTQDAANETYARDGLFPKGVGKDQLQSSAIFLDPNTGEILSMSGGREYESRFGLNRATGTTRQPGSIIKPISVYGPALDKGYSPNYRILDAPFKSGNYSPQNYDHSYRGMINMTTALKYSVNVTAVRMLNEIGVETGWEFAVNCGLPLVEDDKGLSLALGGLTHGVSTLDMAVAYACFANGGYYIAPTSIQKITDKYDNIIYEHTPDKKQVMDEKTAYAMNTMLKATIQSGTGTNGNIGRPAAGKTGTTQLPKSFGNRKGNKDSWWAGYTPDVVGICWMGFDSDKSKVDGSPQYMVNVFGGQYPVKIWKNIMNVALDDIPSSDWEKPDDYKFSIDTSDSSSKKDTTTDDEDETTVVVPEETPEPETPTPENPTPENPKPETPVKPVDPPVTPPTQPEKPVEPTVPVPEPSAISSLNNLSFTSNYKLAKEMQTNNNIVDITTILRSLLRVG